MTKPIISIVLGSYNRKSFLKSAIKAIRNNGIPVTYEVIVIDGGSTDGSIEYLTKQKDIISIIQHNMAFWKGSKIDKKSWGYYMNIAFKAGHGKYVVMISDDCLLVPNSIIKAYYLFEEKLNKGEKIGAIAFYWRNYPNENLYYVKQTLGHKLSVNHGMYLKEALAGVGFCNEDDYPFYYGDGDLSLKLWNAGYEIVDCKESFVEHFHFANMLIRQNNSIEKEKYKKSYKDKWKGIFYDENIDNQSGKIYLHFKDRYDTARLFRHRLSYYLGLIQSRFGWLYAKKVSTPTKLGDA